MAKLRTYLLNLRIAFAARDDVHAEHQADKLDARVEEFLEPGDTVRQTQLICIGDNEKSDEVITLLKLARNGLCKLGFKDTMNHAQQLDMIIWRLDNLRAEDDPDQLADYDYNRIINVTKAVARGENPLY